MATWTVFVKSITGHDRHVIEADIADWSEDGQFLEFSDFGAAEDSFDAFLKLQAAGKTSDELREHLRRLVRSLGSIRVASFRKDLIMGFRLGLEPPTALLKD
jgi:hypothetical protein